MSGAPSSTPTAANGGGRIGECARFFNPSLTYINANAASLIFDVYSEAFGIACTSWEAAMTQESILRVHRSWQDWTGMLLGLLIGLSPWLSGQMGDQTMMLNAIFAGAAVFVLAEFEAADLHRWQEAAEILVGSWVIASPFVFGYWSAGPLWRWHIALGAATALLAILELWQDRNLTNKELAEHGK